ncbi:Cyclin-dependent protein kinase inhibitor SMR15 [Linum grandiflorum]
MGFSSGIHLRSPLKPIYTKIDVVDGGGGGGDGDVYGGCPQPTTPKAEEARILEKLPCPPPPRKRRATFKRKCNAATAGVREFFTPPDLETVFVRRHVQRASG